MRRRRGAKGKQILAEKEEEEDLDLDEKDENERNQWDE
jgi:hypothetical protein